MGLSNTGGCVQRRTSNLRLLGHSSADVSHQASKHFLIQVWMRVGMIQIIPCSCKYSSHLQMILASSGTNYVCCSMVFRWVFIPWLQVELNNYQDRINHSRKRRDKKSVFFIRAHYLAHSSLFLTQRFCLMESQNSYSPLQRTMVHWTSR